MSSRFQPPPIIKACERFAAELYTASLRFNRTHRHEIGKDLRDQARKTMRIANRAWRDQIRRRQWVEQLVWEVDELKQLLQQAKLVGATTSFRQFEHFARLADGLGAQVGGWHRQLHPSAQNAAAHRGEQQRGQKLSTRAASTGANP